jgi:hypothetical protein
MAYYSGCLVVSYKNKVFQTERKWREGRTILRRKNKAGRKFNCSSV